MRLARVLLGILLPAMMVAGPARADFIGISFFSPGDVFTFNESGDVTLLGPSGFGGLNSLAKDSSGNLYTQGFSTKTGAAFVLIDPLTGVGTAVAPNADQLDVRGLAFDPSDTLYAIVNVFGGTLDFLYTIDLQTGEGQLIGSTGFTNLQGLEFDSSGTLFGWDTAGNRGLVIINTTTGAGSLVGAAGGTLDIQTLAFDADGALFGAGQNLYSINAATGQFTLVSNIGHDIRGFASIDDAPTCAADLTGDGQVGSADLAILLGDWGAMGSDADLDGDGMVGSGDLAALLGSWGPCS
ncbi:MAG: hypothetical protein EA376_03090 [Phycisphaeraceae bacterium]|nr:MAG: hypothetical protein EA376_03090 [Phycisphaeraceae bacterium]